MGYPGLVKMLVQRRNIQGRQSFFIVHPNL
jgi:hypothetical protein